VGIRRGRRVSRWSAVEAGRVYEELERAKNWIK
jgi:hypothetical protein